MIKPVGFNLQWNVWTDARRPVSRLWIRSAEVRRVGGDVVRRMGTQQLQWNDYIGKGNRYTRALRVDCLKGTTSDLKSLC